MPLGTAGRDTAWNLAGLLLPLPVAIAVVPALLATLGDARFGLLTLAWAIMGYFTLFDFGLGRATTQGIAQARAAGTENAVLALGWSSAWAHLVLGTIGGLVLLITAGPVARLLALPAPLEGEFTRAMAWLAFSIPCIVVATAARGVLEGVGRFDAMNIVRLPSTLWTYLAPLVVVQWTASLPAVIGAIALGRVLALMALGVACVRAVPALARPQGVSIATLTPLARLGLWITVATLCVPVMSTLDRIVIGTRVSVEAVGWYAAPYEAVARLWIVSTAVLTVAFPAFTAALAAPPAQLGRVFRHALAALVLVVLPAAIAIVALAPLAIPWWLGRAGGPDTVRATQWLAAGMALNVPAQVGATLLQATRGAERVARVQVVCVVAYGFGVWWAAARWGIVGVAMVWVAYGLVLATWILGLASSWMRTHGSPGLTRRQWAALGGAAAGCCAWTAWASYAPRPYLVSLLAAASLSLVLAAWLWRALVDEDMRHLVLHRLRALA